VISIAGARDAVMATKISKKKDLAKSADVEMADATKPGPSIQSMIDKAVSARLKASTSKVSTRFVPYSTNTHSLVAAPKKGDSGKKKSSTSKKVSRPAGASSTSSLRAQTRSQGSRRHQGWQREGEEPRRRRSFVVRARGKVGRHRPPEFYLAIPSDWYVNPTLIPDSCLLSLILTLLVVLFLVRL
jgi:hypothetical protein